jgi:hypothetical protein
MLNKILLEQARLADKSAMARFLASISRGAELGQFLAAEPEQLLLHRYDEQTRVYYFVVSDGTTVRCFSVVNLSFDEAATIVETIVDECESIDAWNFTNFQKAVERALEITVERLH